MHEFPKKPNGQLDFIAYSRFKVTERQEAEHWIQEHGSPADKEQLTNFLKLSAEQNAKDQKRMDNIDHAESNPSKHGSHPKKGKGGCSVM